MEMKSKRRRTPRHWRLRLSGVLSLLGGISALAQSPSLAPAPPPDRQPIGNASEPRPQAAGEKAWGILRDGLKDDSADKRAKAVRALGLLPGNAEAEKAAINALQTKNRMCGWPRPRP